MKITHLHLQNFRGFENLEITIPTTSNIAVFIGENGSGKSSVLDAVEKLLSTVNMRSNNTIQPDDIMIGALAENCSIAMDLMYLDKKYVSILRYDQNYSLNNTENEGLYEIRKIEKKPILLSFKAFAKEPQRTRYSELIGRNGLYDNCFNRNVQDDYSFKKWFEYEENIENEKRLNDDDKFRSPILEAVRQAVEIFLTTIEGNAVFKNLRTKRILVKDARRASMYDSYLYLLKNGKEFNFDQLSSGEKSMLIMVSEIARRLALANDQKGSINGIGIVLIDEIEQHLHPKWQQNILPALAKTFPKVQFIVATHSPKILGSLSNDNASIFRLEDGKCFTEDGQLGRDANWILETVMDTPEMDAVPRAAFGAYFEKIRTSDFADPQARQELVAIRRDLEEKYGANHTELNKADILIARKSKKLPVL